MPKKKNDSTSFHLVTTTHLLWRPRDLKPAGGATIIIPLAATIPAGGPLRGSAPLLLRHLWNFFAVAFTLYLVGGGERERERERAQRRWAEGEYEFSI